MKVIKYENLTVRKTFPRRKIVGIAEEAFIQMTVNFTETYRRNLTESPPDYNPLQHVVYDTKQGPFDLYDPGVIGYFGAFIVSNRLLKILNEYNLQEHKVFPGVKYTFKGEERDDMNFLIFYKDYEQYIDFAKSTYRKVVHNHLEFKHDRSKSYKDAVLQDDIRFSSKEQYLFEARKKSMLSTDPEIIFKYICCPECLSKDIFFFNSNYIGIYVSQRLVKRMAEEKIKGIHYWGNFTYEFTG